MILMTWRKLNDTWLVYSDLYGDDGNCVGEMLMIIWLGIPNTLLWYRKFLLLAIVEVTFDIWRTSKCLFGGLWYIQNWLIFCAHFILIRNWRFVLSHLYDWSGTKKYATDFIIIRFNLAYLCWIPLNFRQFCTIN